MAWPSTLTDMICCPGADYCSLAHAGSLDVASKINQRFDDLDHLYDLEDAQPGPGNTS